MSRYLLDINLLLALHDEDHLDHQLAHRWSASQENFSWASCPITENGFIRIISQPEYPHPVTPSAATQILQTTCADTDHEFWPDSLSLLGQDVKTTAILGPNQVTDTYLLALATANDGCFVTLDKRISLDAVRSATPDNLHILSG